MATKKQARNARAERVAQARSRQRAAERRRAMSRWVTIALAVIVVAGGVIALGLTHKTKAGLGPENIPLEKGAVLASASSAVQGQAVDGIQCNAGEQLAYHIHVHLAVYVNGSLRPLPLGIGIVKPRIQQTGAGAVAGATKCYYWLHVHVQDGIIHIESPTQKVYTLGQFFDEWQQPLSSTTVATASGAVTAYVNGKVYTGDPRQIPLSPHAVIQLDVGTSTVAPQTIDWANTNL